MLQLELTAVREEFSGLSAEALKVEFLGAWSNLLQKRDEAHKKLLIAEGESSGWTQERKEQLRRTAAAPRGPGHRQWIETGKPVWPGKYG